MQLPPSIVYVSCNEIAGGSHQCCRCQGSESSCNPSQIDFKLYDQFVK